MIPKMIESLRLLLGANMIDVAIDDKTFDAIIEMGISVYDRHNKYGAFFNVASYNKNQYSWVHEYCLAYSKRMLAEIMLTQESRLNITGGAVSGDAAATLATMAQYAMEMLVLEISS